MENLLMPGLILATIEEDLIVTLGVFLGLIILICFFFLCYNVSKIRKILEQKNKNKNNEETK